MEHTLITIGMLVLAPTINVILSSTYWILIKKVSNKGDQRERKKEREREREREIDWINGLH